MTKVEEISSLTDLMASLYEANDTLEKLISAEHDLRRSMTECRNHINDLQKRIDVKVNAVRSSAPRDTDWARTRTPRELCP